MARPLRIEFPGAVYHVATRGDASVFADDEDGTGGVADDAFGGATHEEALEAGAAMGADDKKVSVLFSGCLGDFAKWNSRADTDFC